MKQEQLVSLTADIVASHAANNSVPVGEVSNLIQQVYEALFQLGQEPDAPSTTKAPAVSVRASIKPDYIICMGCGGKQKMLKRHLESAHGLTPVQYRQEFNLASDYPMTAPNYSMVRKALAQKSGLGRNLKSKAGRKKLGIKV